MPSVKEKLTDLFKDFEAALANGNKIRHDVWAERAFACIMGEDFPFEEDASANRYTEGGSQAPTPLLSHEERAGV